MQCNAKTSEAIKCNLMTVIYLNAIICFAEEYFRNYPSRNVILRILGLCILCNSQSLFLVIISCRRNIIKSGANWKLSITKSVKS